MTVVTKTFTQIGLTQVGYVVYDPTLNSGLGGYQTPQSQIPQANVTGLTSALSNTVLLNGTYNDPSFIVSINGSKLIGTVTATALAAGTYSVNISGNAATVSNGVYSNGTYPNPTWITSLDSNKLINTLPAGLLSGTYNINVSGNAATATTATTANTANTATTATNAPNYLPLAGGAMTGAITLPGNAASVLQATPLQQVQSLIATNTKPIAQITSSNNTLGNAYAITNANNNGLITTNYNGGAYANIASGALTAGTPFVIGIDPSLTSASIQVNAAGSVFNASNFSGLKYLNINPGQFFSVLYDGNNFKCTEISGTQAVVTDTTNGTTALNTVHIGSLLILSGASDSLQINLDTATQFYPVNAFVDIVFTGTGTSTTTAGSGVTLLGNTVLVKNAFYRLKKISQQITSGAISSTVWQLLGQANPVVQQSLSGTFTGCGITSVGFTAVLTNTGQQCLLTLGYFSTGTASSSGVLTSSAIIPASLRPATNIGVQIQITDGVNCGGIALVRTDGSIQIYSQKGGQATGNLNTGGAASYTVGATQSLLPWNAGT